MMNKQSQGPDPEILNAINRLKQTELSPLEEVIYNSWAQANGLEEGGEGTEGFDFRDLYMQTGGKVFPPGQLKSMAEKQGAMEMLMGAQKDHDASSPMQAMMNGGPKKLDMSAAPSDQGAPMGGPVSSMMGGGQPPMGGGDF